MENKDTEEYSINPDIRRRLIDIDSYRLEKILILIILFFSVLLFALLIFVFFSPIPVRVGDVCLSCWNN